MVYIWSIYVSSIYMEEIERKKEKTFTSDYKMFFFIFFVFFFLEIKTKIVPHIKDI